MEEKKKMKSVASIPANYVSIIQLQERWMREKEVKQKKEELVEREVKQQVHGQRRREETMEPSVKLEEKGLRVGFNKPSGVNRWKKEPTCVEKEEVEKVPATVSKKEEKGLRVGLTKPSGVNRGKKEPNCVEQEEVEKVTAIVSKEEENEGEGDLSEKKNKKKKKKKKKKKVKEIVKCESKVSPAHIPRKEDKYNPVKEIVVAKDLTAAEEIQFQELWIKKEEGGVVKGPVRVSYGQGYVGKNQRRVTRTTTTRDMVWVKKGKNDGSANE